MKNVLVIESSHNREATGSRYISSKIQARIKERYPEAKITIRDLTKEQLPHLSETTLGSFYTPPEVRSPEQKEAVALSDVLTEELLSSDLLIIAVPLWNFGVPSSVKAWIDHVVRSGKTFSYGPSGVIGLAKNTKAIIAASTGGVFSEGPLKAMDFVVPYLQGVLNFIGITDVQIIRLEGTKVPQVQGVAVKKAEQAVENLKI